VEIWKFSESQKVFPKFNSEGKRDAGKTQEIWKDTLLMQLESNNNIL
jgi:hypothetical protein